jgi:hypothetical protein
MLLVRWNNNIEVCRFCGLHPTLRSATEFQCGCSGKNLTLIFWLFDNSEKKFHYCVFYISFGLAFVSFLQSDDGVIVVLT